jgi:hypothetical protein
MPGTKARSLVFGLAAIIAVLTVGVPVGAATNCTAGYCLVSVPGVYAHPAVAYGKFDAYWRDVPEEATIGPTVGATEGAATTISIDNAFDWGAFGIGAGVAFGSSLLLTGLTGVVLFRVTRRRSAAPVGTA